MFFRVSLVENIQKLLKRVSRESLQSIFVKGFFIFQLAYIYWEVLSKGGLRPLVSDPDVGFVAALFSGTFFIVALVVIVAQSSYKKLFLMMQKRWKQLVMISLLPMILFLIPNIFDKFFNFVGVLTFGAWFLIGVSLLSFPIIFFILWLRFKKLYILAMSALFFVILFMNLDPMNIKLQRELINNSCLQHPSYYCETPYYYIKNDSVCVVSRTESQPCYSRKIDNIDKKNFVKLKNGYAHDGTNVFYRGFVIQADVDSFENLNSFYAKDRNTVFVKGKVLEKAHASHFYISETCQSSRCAMDQENFFRNGEIINDIDVQTLELLQSDGICLYARDQHAVYYDGEKMTKADRDTIRILDERRCYARDTVSLFHKGKKLKEINLENTTFVQGAAAYEPFLKDEKNVYYKDQKLNLDAQTLLYVGDGYIKDSQNVYYRDKKIDGADANTFEVPQSSRASQCARDKNYLYFEEERDEHPICKKAFKGKF